MFSPLRELNGQQWRAFVAAFLGWTLDAFDFFLVTFVVVRIATDFNRAIPEVAFAITITDAPVSASTAIHSVATPVTAATTNAAFSTIEIARFILMLRTVARLKRSAYGIFSSSSAAAASISCRDGGGSLLRIGGSINSLRIGGSSISSEIGGSNAADIWRNFSGSTDT